MTSWKSRLFGDTRFNFYGWILVGLLLIVTSAVFVYGAIDAGLFKSPVALMLAAIYLLLLGLFGVALQNYSARVAAVLDARGE